MTKKKTEAKADENKNKEVWDQKLFEGLTSK